MIFRGEGPQVAVITPSAGPLGRYLAFEMSLDALVVPESSSLWRVSGSDSLALGVNTTIKGLLEQERPPDKFFFIDDDHEFDSDVVMKLLAHPKEARVVMALCTRKQPNFLLMGFTDERQMWDEGRGRVVTEFKNLSWSEISGKAGLWPVQSVGRGGLMVDASVFREVPGPWFQLGQIDPEEFHEDVFFSRLCRESGVRMYMDIGDGEKGPIGTGHLCPVAAWPYRYENGSLGVMLRWPNGKTLVFPMTRAES
jgi:hypothetical protein